MVSFFIQYLHVWIRIRIHKAPEYGSESTTLVLTRVYGCDGTTEENLNVEQLNSANWVYWPQQRWHLCKICNRDSSFLFNSFGQMEKNIVFCLVK